MMDVMTIIAANGFLAFILICALYYLIKTIVIRGTRMINIALRGWPPAHLDADGDWKPEPKKEG